MVQILADNRVEGQNDVDFEATGAYDVYVGVKFQNF